MRSINKTPPPREFSDWLAKRNENWEPNYGNLQNPEKRELHDHLIGEQFERCCYCGHPIERETSHIEHFAPQEQFDHLDVEYTNMYASCIRDASKVQELHCGHAKQAFFDEAMIISPLDPGCVERFRYSQAGAIRATDPSDESAAYMLRILNLDATYLRNRRAAAINSVFSEAFMQRVTDQELRALADAYHQSEFSRSDDEYPHVLRRFAEQELGG